MANPKAQGAKEKGNVVFKAGDYPTAIGHYTSAILADRADPTYPLNRAAAYLKLGKAEDAERDCNTVLELNPKNVKALFRRGQARVGMNKLLEAHIDFSGILVAEPSNTAAQEELKKVVNLIQTEKAKKAKSPANAMSSSLEPTVAPKRRRVPIKIIDPSQPAASSSSTLSEQKAQGEAKPISVTSQAATATNKKSDTLEAVSSRPLKPETPSVPPVLSAAAAALKPEPKAATKAEVTPAPKASSFRDARQVREIAKPSRVGGGIFRASGKNTIFTVKEDRAGAFKPESAFPADAPKSEPSIAAQSQAPVNKARETSSTPAPVNPAPPAPTVVVEAPATLFDFNKAWTNARSAEEKWQLINTISPTQFPGFCKSSMEAGLFSSILSVFADVLNSGDDTIKTTVLAYMENFPKIARFSTVVLFFSRAEKAVAKKVWELLGVDKPIGAWAPVA